MKKVLGYAVVAISVVLTGCASSGKYGSYSSAELSKQQKNVWERVRKGFAMPDLDQDPKVDYWTNYYASRPKSLEVMASRSSRYIYYIAKELEKRHLPSELALLPFVESAYNADALSRSKAAGLWQFIPSTGTHYNLEQDWWKDQRRDTIHSTRAALDYLSYLYQFQGNDWHLALASYNRGEGAIRRLRERNAAAGLGTDFLSLSLPAETRNYVPKLLAIKRIVANPSKYGVKLPNIPDQPYFVEVSKDKDMDVSTVTRLAGISDEEFRLLNPANKQKVLLAQHGSKILLPQKNAEQFKKNLSSYKGELSAWRGYTPTPGESLASIAQRYGISLESLKAMNGYGRYQNVAVSSRTLIVPRSPGLSTDSSATGIDTRDITNPIASNSTLLASTQPRSVSTGAVSNIPAQTTPAVRLAGTSPQVRLASATTTSAPAVAQNTPSPATANDDILKQVMASSTNAGTGATGLAANNPGVETVRASEDLIGGLVATNSAPTTAAVETVPTAPLAPAPRPTSGATVATLARPQTATYRADSSSVGARTVSAPMYTQRTSNGPTIHTVMAGDTLYSLAKRYGTTVDNIRALNNLGGREIRTGERLHMPGSGVQS